jgi:predicted dehydrogenase
MSKTKILLIGYGYWGPNLARNLNQNSNIEFSGILEIDKDLHKKISEDYPEIPIFNSIDEIGDDHDAAIVSTPATTHFSIGQSLLEKGLHVLIEKPLATTIDDCEKLIKIAEDKQLKLMVGHTYLYNASVIKIKEIIESGEIGKLLTVHSERLNLGQIRQDINVMWNLAPHDFSIISYLVGSYPVSVSASGNDFIKEGMHDIVYIHLGFDNNITGFIHNSWLHPLKSRKVIVVGSEGMIVFDDTQVNNQVTVYEKGVDWDKITKSEKGKNSRFEIIDGDYYSPQIETQEPLATEIQAFVNWIQLDKKPISDSKNGLEIVRILEKAQEGLLT